MGVILSSQLGEPLAVASLADEIAYRLECAIMDGEIPLGARLGQDELCAQFGVSRTPVREALAKLDAVNLVSLQPNRGAVVRVPGREEVQQIYQLRAELEGFAAQLVAERLAPAPHRALTRAQEELEHVLEGVLAQAPEGDPALAGPAHRVATANDAFHDTLLEAAGNEPLRATAQRLRGAFPKDYVTRAAASENELRDLNVEHHHAIIAAVSDGDGARARAAMSHHIAHAGTLLIDYLSARDFWTEHASR